MKHIGPLWPSSHPKTPLLKEPCPSNSKHGSAKDIPRKQSFFWVPSVAEWTCASPNLSQFTTPGARGSYDLLL